MHDLYDTLMPDINQHIATMFRQGELQPKATLKKHLTVRAEDKRRVRRLLEHYNLETIIAIG